MAELAQGWIADVERGPDWLIIRLSPPPRVSLPPWDGEDGADLADTLWSLVERHFTYRLLLECEELTRLDSTLVAQLLVLDRRLHEHDGMLRLCGLSELNQQVLERCRLNGRFPSFRDRSHAVLGTSRPQQPR
ncbi:MAG TPA: STAS domain-containing protein [Pirellulales bacterium]|nr:STAS domain-containing protein [Pirellulales bacterium]